MLGGIVQSWDYVSIQYVGCYEHLKYRRPTKAKAQFLGQIMLFHFISQIIDLVRLIVLCQIR